MKKVFIIFLTAIISFFPARITSAPQHTPMSEIFEGDGDDQIVCYKQKHRNFFFITFGLSVALGLLALNQYRIKKKSAKALQDKNKIIEEKNKDIVDSINYAKRIQGAILPEEALLTRLLPEHFLYFRPKDIVSGDFYWVAEKKETVLLAAADCTGHGVPGAFMSMIGNAFLNEIVNEKGIVAPAEILNKLREMIIGALKQGEGSDSKDGMDITLVSLSKSGEETLVKFAGANNPIWIIQSGKLREIKGDKQPVGVTSGLAKEFTEHSFSLAKGDQLYLFSDGFADQFGGKDGKKFRSKNMQDLVMSVHDQSMSLQKKILAEKMDQWKSELEQVDDMLVIGLRI